MSREQSNPLPAQQPSAPKFYLQNACSPFAQFWKCAPKEQDQGKDACWLEIIKNLLPEKSTRSAVATDAYLLLEKYQLRLDPRCHWPAYTNHNLGGIAIVYQLTSHDSSEITYVILVIIDRLTRWEDLSMGFTTEFPLKEHYLRSDPS